MNRKLCHNVLLNVHYVAMQKAIRREPPSSWLMVATAPVWWMMLLMFMCHTVLFGFHFHSSIPLPPPLTLLFSRLCTTIFFHIRPNKMEFTGIEYERISIIIIGGRKIRNTRVTALIRKFNKHFFCLLACLLALSLV